MIFCLFAKNTAAPFWRLNRRVAPVFLAALFGSMIFAAAWAWHVVRVLDGY
jgi:hypothetical protein